MNNKAQSEYKEGIIKISAKINKIKSKKQYRRSMNPNQVLWKDKQDWQIFNHTHQETKEDQVNKIWNDRGEITTDTKEIQRTVRQYYKNIYVNKLDNPDEMDNFLETNNLPKLNQEES